jgi:hypothetical protein
MEGYDFKKHYLKVEPTQVIDSEVSLIQLYGLKLKETESDALYKTMAVPLFIESCFKYNEK